MNRTSHQSPFFLYRIAVLAFLSTALSPAISRAQTPVAGTQGTATAPAPAEVAPPTPEAPPADQLRAEAALGGDLTREYQRYQVMFPNGDYTFPEYLLDEYEYRRRRGIVLGAIVAPVLASLTVLGDVGLYIHAKGDGGGYCAEIDHPDDYNYCDREDTGEIVGIVLISTFGGIATVATFAPGIVRIARYSKRANRIRPLVARPSGGLRPPVKPTFAVSPSSAAVGFRF